MFTIHVHVYVPKTCPRKHDLKKKKENYAESCMDTNHTSQFGMMLF